MIANVIDRHYPTSPFTRFQENDEVRVDREILDELVPDRLGDIGVVTGENPYFGSRVAVFVPRGLTPKGQVRGRTLLLGPGYLELVD